MGIHIPIVSDANDSDAQIGLCAMSEAHEQMRVVEWCKTTDYLSGNTLGLRNIFHIPNGGLRSKSEAARLKAMGVRAGVSDLFIPVPSGDKHGLWIEMKASGGVISEAQDGWLDSMRLSGYEAVLAFDADEAIRAISDYLNLEAK